MQWIPMAVSKALGRQALVLEKNSPAILFGTGIVGMVGSTVLACRATLKLEEVLDEGKENVKKAKMRITVRRTVRRISPSSIFRRQ
jgi:hypothetical protein